MAGLPPFAAFTIGIALIGAMFGLLILILGWMGNKVYNKIDEIGRSVHNIETDLHGKISALDRRVTTVETRVDMALKVRI